jgi:RHS repeat-associated protein
MFGADFGGRLRLVRLPACAVSTPERPECRIAAAVDGATNVVGSRVVSADALEVGGAEAGMVAAGSAGASWSTGDAASVVAAGRQEPARPVSTVGTSPASSGTGGSAVVYALVGGPSSSGGDFTRTSLSPTYGWAAGSQGGEFTYAVPLEVPAGVGGPVPDITLRYSSGSVDGRTASTNGQSSWLGEGWDYSPGYIEQGYRACNEDGWSNRDLCWLSGDAAGTAKVFTMVFAGRSTRLVRDDASGVWRGEADDGSRVEQLTAGWVNGDQLRRYWKLTSQDGTQYFFGQHLRGGDAAAVTNSTQNVLVYGNQVNEPCHNTVHDYWSGCLSTYRWYLDYVVDPRGNSMTYFYQKYQGQYGNWFGNDHWWYDITVSLDHIDYGTRAGSESGSAAPFQTGFTVYGRCVTEPCSGHPENWLDTPWDLWCSLSATSCPVPSPTFWNPYRLGAVTTMRWDPAAGGYVGVDQWTIGHSFPATGGDPSSPSLWLGSITRTGTGSPNLSGPTMFFGGNNRPNLVANTAPFYNHIRIEGVNTGSGNQTNVSYAPAECTLANTASVPWDQNPLRCFPQWNGTGWAYYHKYIATSVSEVDQTGSSPDETWNYEYYPAAGSSSGTLWRYDSGDSAVQAHRSWTDFAGYSTVIVRHGPAGGAQTATRNLYYRGLSGDATGGGDYTRQVSVTDSTGTVVDDARPLRGQLRETLTLDGDTVVGNSIYTPWLQQTGQRTAPWIQGNAASFYVRAGVLDTATRITATSTWRSTRTTTTYNATYGLPTTVRDDGDTAVGTDDVCTTTSYVTPDTGKWLIAYPSQSLTTDCATTPSGNNYLAGGQTFYDGSTTVGATPTAGLPTKSTTLASASGTTLTWQQAGRVGYDTYGRVTDSWDAADRRTSTAYTPATGGPVTQATVTNALGHVVTTTLDPGRGLPLTITDPNGRTTTIAYDPLGRLTKVWQPGRATSGTPDVEYLPSLGGAAGNVVTTKTLGPNGNQIVSHELFDGRLRPKQTQHPAPVANGGRIITDIGYDTRGLGVKQSRFWTTGAPSTTLVSFTDATVKAQTRTSYDLLERVTASQLWSQNTMLWQTTTAYDGDRVMLTPPAGGIPTTAISNARGQTTELRQHTAATAGSYQATTYGYDRLGRLKTVTDPAGNQWQRSYDLAGRVTEKKDPDTGTTTLAYNAAGELTASTDARGITLSYTYDTLGRRTERWHGPVGTGTKLAAWTYDTLAGGGSVKGQLVASTRYKTPTEAYTVETTQVDDQYRPLQTKVSLPATEGTLTGPWITNLTYKPDGSLATRSYPTAGSLPAETVTSSYDNNGYPLTLTGLDAYISATGYDNWGAVNTLTLGAATSTKNLELKTSIDEATGRLTESRVSTENQATPGTWVPQLIEQYGYDQAGNVKYIKEVNSSGTTVSNQCFAYDPLRQLTEAWTTTAATCQDTPSQAAVAGPDPYWTSYRYNSIGNRTTDTVHTTGGNRVRNYTYPTSSATSTRPHAVSTVTATGITPGTDSYGYDQAGNTTTRTLAGTPGQSLTWDPEGHLATVTDTAGTTSYLYTADGDRLLRYEPGNVATLYLDGYELRRSSTGVTCTRYYGVAARTTTGGLTWIAADHHGTGQLAINPTTLAVTRRKTDPFGNPRGPAVTWPTPQGFVGGTRDPTGLTHLGAREYEPNTGRFISVDPILDLADPVQMNGYAYANSNPTSGSDPDGLCIRLDDRNGPCIGNETSYAGTPDPINSNNHNNNAYLGKKGPCAIPGACASPAKPPPSSKTDYGNGVTITTDNGVATIHIPGTAPYRLPPDANPDAIGRAIAKMIANGYKNSQERLNHDPAPHIIGIACQEILAPGVCSGDLIGTLNYDYNAAIASGNPYSNANYAEELTGSDLNPMDLAIAGAGAVVGGVAARGIAVGRGQRHPGSCNTNSFDPDTPILMADGTTKPIKDIKIGDNVLATNPETGHTAPKPVTVLHLNLETNLTDLTITLADGTTAVLHTTTEHPFWNATQQNWTDASQLTPGQLLHTPTGATARVTTVQPFNQPATMHNLTIADLHTYYVLAGNTPVLVHNEGGDDPSLGDMKKLSDSQAKRIVGDVHEFKQDVVGRGAKSSSYDVYIEKSTGNLYLMDKAGRNPIPTYVNKGGTWHPGAGGAVGGC